MRLLHIADLHFGKTIYGVSMLESGDQPNWVDGFLKMVDEQGPDAVLIAGDVYDRNSPSAAAVDLFGCLIDGLAERGICVLVVAGNHDSGPKLSFAKKTLANQNVHIAGTIRPKLDHVTLHDEFGPVTFWLMPYMFPAAVGKAFDDPSIRDYDTAVRRLLSEQDIDTSVRNVLIAHQNVTSSGSEAIRGGSESMVGGVGQIDFTAFDDFDYVALGHIHAAYPVGRPEVRYAGSPMCYHFNETRQPKKGPVLVELGEKGAPARIEVLQIPPLHPMREMRGGVDDLKEAELARRDCGEYLKLVLTDQPLTPEICDFFQHLAESRSSILMERISEFRQFADVTDSPESEILNKRTVSELFADFYAERCGEPPAEKDLILLHRASELLHDGSEDGEPAGRLLDFLLSQERSNA